LGSMGVLFMDVLPWLLGITVGILQIIYLIKREHNLVLGPPYEEPPTEAETLEAGYIKGYVSEQEYSEGLGSLNQEPKEQNEPPF